MPGHTARRCWSFRFSEAALVAAFCASCTDSGDDGSLSAGASSASSGGAPVEPDPEPAALEEGELRPGGATTSDVLDVSAFLQPAANLALADRGDFQSGLQFFQLVWEEAPGRADVDGLGPTFHTDRCVGCHDRNGRAQPARSSAERTSVGVLLRVGVGDEGRPSASYGSQLQPKGLAGASAEVSVRRFEDEHEHRLVDGSVRTLVRPRYELDQFAFGPLEADARISPRLSPQIVGQGLLEAIDEADLLRGEDVDDANDDGVSGRAARLGDGRIGRFGWKASQPDVRTQTAAAFHEDLGITSELFPDENCPPAQLACRQARSGGVPELSTTRLEATAAYVRSLAVPARRNGEDAEVLRGKALFHQVGCASCHRPSYVTGAHAHAELSGQRIWPYTDLLLHDMGEQLADGRPEGGANGSEWRTPPLWTLGLIETVNGRLTLLHDGRARSIDEAILWHGGEATRARTSYEALPESAREALRRFVESL